MLKSTSLSKKVYEHLKSQIYLGTFPTMDVVYEVQLAEKLGVSRTPVREAVRVLENEGLVEQLSGGGIRAHPISLRDIQDAIDARIAIELLTVRLAAERITRAQTEELEAILDRTGAAVRMGLLGDVMKENEAFHHFIASCTDNRLMEGLLARIYTYIRAHNLLHRLVEQSDVQTVLASVYEQHRTIAEAITSGDATLAAARMRQHLEEVSLLYQSVLE